MIPGLKARLIAPYQHDGVDWMLKRELTGDIPGGFLCDEMGLGKTVQIIAVILGNPQPRTLIVCPKSVAKQWQSEMKRFAPVLRTHIYAGPNRKFDPTADVTITTYSIFQKKTTPQCPRPELSGCGWSRIVLDEGHEIRNKKSFSWKNLYSIPARHRWVVSGTPVYNNVKDFIALSVFVGIPSAVVQANINMVRERFVLRRTKEDVAEFNERLRLPNCEFENVELEMYPEEFEHYRAVYLECRNEIFEMLRNKDTIKAHMNMIILECLLRCRQAAIHPQLYINSTAKKYKDEPYLWEHKVRKFEYLRDSIVSHPHEKSLVFCQYLQEMDVIEDMMRDIGVKIFRIDGSVSSQCRADEIEKFRRTSEHCVFLIQIKSGGVGLNLQEATRVYITAPSWNPATELQAIGRAHRTGQTKVVHVKKLVIRGTEEVSSIELTMMNLQNHKSIVCSEVLNDPRLIRQLPKVNATITIKDIANLFRN